MVVIRGPEAILYEIFFKVGGQDDILLVIKINVTDAIAIGNSQIRIFRYSNCSPAFTASRFHVPYLIGVCNTNSAGV